MGMIAEPRRALPARLPLPRTKTGPRVTPQSDGEPVAPVLYATRRRSGSQREPLSLASAASASAAFLSVA